MKRVFLLRHPHVQAAEESICYGASDVSLSPAGKRQAREMADFLSKHQLNTVFTSDLSRAAYPARLIARQQNIDCVLTPQLREINCGSWEGMSYNAIQQQYPVEYNQWVTLERQFCFPGGESFDEFKQRILPAYHKILTNHCAPENQDSETNIAVITHGGVTRVILMELLQMPWNAAWNLGQDFAALNIIEYHQEIESPQDYAIIKLLNGSCR